MKNRVMQRIWSTEANGISYSIEYDNCGTFPEWEVRASGNTLPVNGMPSYYVDVTKKYRTYEKAIAAVYKLIADREDALNKKADTPPCPAQLAEFDAILAEMAALHRRKSADYGPDPIAETGMEGIIVRMTDKLHRVRRLSAAWADGAAVSDETIQDTLIDLASYAVIAMVLLRGKWGK